MENENQNSELSTPFVSEGNAIREQATKKIETGQTTLTTSDIANSDTFLESPTFLNQWDLILLIVFFGASLMYGITNGKKGTAIITIAIYMSLAIVQAMPDLLLNVSTNTSAAFQLTTFIGVFALLFYLFSRSALLRTFSIEGKGSVIQMIILSLLHAGLLLSVVISFLPEAYTQNFSNELVSFFTGQWQVFGWIVAPILAMFFLGKKE